MLNGATRSTRGTIQPAHQDPMDWVDRIGSPVLRIMLVVGQPHLEKSAEKAIKTLGPRIRHVHSNENSAKSSKHAELVAETIDWEVHADFSNAFPTSSAATSETMRLRRERA